MSSRAPTEARELPHVRASCRTHDLKASFEIDNVLATLSSNRRISCGNENFREIIGPVVASGDFKFELRFVYGVNEGSVDLKQNVGYYFERTDKSKQTALVMENFVCLNVDAAKNKVYRDESFGEVIAGERVGYCPSFKENEGEITGLDVARILDSSQGWLHEGVFRMYWEVSVVTDPDVKTKTVVDGDAAQVEVCNSLSALLKSSLFADATLVVDGERISVHSVILSARSPVFAAMFSADMKESRDKEVMITDLSVEAVRELVSFFYTGRFEEQALADDDSTLALLKAAHRYEAARVVRRCVDTLSSRLSVENVSERLELAELIECESFKEECLAYMQREIRQVQGTASFALLVQRRPALLKDVLEAVVGPPPKRPKTAAATPAAAKAAAKAAAAKAKAAGRRR